MKVDDPAIVSQGDFAAAVQILSEQRARALHSRFDPGERHSELFCDLALGLALEICGQESFAIEIRKLVDHRAQPGEDFFVGIMVSCEGREATGPGGLRGQIVAIGASGLERRTASVVVGNRAACNAVDPGLRPGGLAQGRLALVEAQQDFLCHIVGVLPGNPAGNEGSETTEEWFPGKPFFRLGVSWWVGGTWHGCLVSFDRW